MGWIILILFIIVVLIVWISLTENAKKYKPEIEAGSHEPEPVTEAAVVEEEEIAVPARAAPTLGVVQGPKRARTKSSKVDDLTVVEGIGPKVSSLLKEAGITTLAELGQAKESRLIEILENAKLQFLDPGTWAEQARLAAEGKMDELKALQARLKGGRKNE